MGFGRCRWTSLLAIVIALLALPTIAYAAFPGDPGESPRVNTPNDPKFDRCEGDDPDGFPDDTDEPDCTSYFEEDFRLFGFSPDSAVLTPGVHTPYLDCAQLDAQGRAANLAAGDPQCSQIAGIRADTAWKYSTGNPGTVVAILDTGIQWQERELVDKIALNRAELEAPRNGSVACPNENCNGKPGLSVSDYADHPGVSISAGDNEADDILDASDLIARFSNGVDNDPGGNGYVDDIAGWDFFDDDNDPYDASSCCSAGGHGSDRAAEAAAATDNRQGSPGVCPDCQVMPLRVWDTFVVPGDNYAMGVVYATANGADVVEGAVGGLTNTRFARSAFGYADANGVALTLVSSDINSANHNYPTNYNEAIYVGGSLPDTAPNETCSGPGGLPGIGNPTDELPQPPEEFPGFEEGCEQLRGLLGDISGCTDVPPSPLCVTGATQPPTTSFFRNANLTQYGGKADVVLVGATGSANTGQASGAAALLESFSREEGLGGLSGNETRQLLTMTAEDVRPLNTGAIGSPDRANAGWDSHFGYGRVNLAAAMARIANDHEDGAPPCAPARAECIPPEAQIDSPDWFAPVNVDRLPATGLEIHGRAAAPHGDVGQWELEYACGQDALDSEFAAIPGTGIAGSGSRSGLLGSVPKSLLVELAAECDGSVANDPGRPAGTAAEPWPADPYPTPDPERHAVQLRLTVHDAADPANFGRYRKTIFPYADDGNLPGWPRPVGSGSDSSRLVTGSGGESSPRLYDVDGDNELDVLQATSSGELHALNADGTPVASFNSGQPVSTDRYALELNHPVPTGVTTPRESLRVPAIGDVDGDREAEIVATAGEHVYIWALDGTRERKIRLDPALSEPCLGGAAAKPCFDPATRAITSQNHIKRGFFGSPALADLDSDGVLDIVATALDQHLYAFSGTDGADLGGFPVKLDSDDAVGAEIVTSPAIADLDGDAANGPEVIVATNEVIKGGPQPPASIFDIFNAIFASSTGANPVYAVHADGSLVDGWPVTVGVLSGDLLPLVLPGHDAAVLDSDGDGDDEVSISAATSISGQGTRLVDGAGATVRTYQSAVANSPDDGPVVNLADYQSVGDILGAGTPAVFKGGLTLNGVANLLAVNQNLPFSHVEQAWDPVTGAALAGFPRATDDFQLVSQAAVARVGGVGPERQVLVGTGLYNLHAYGPGGIEPSGWPKFSGGWLQATPAIGDADGNGTLDVSTLTREGWSFLWRTGIDACDDSNAEWWTYHHDEHSTANYGGDGRPPATVRGLQASSDGTEAVLEWSAPGDDWLCGDADRFRVILDDAPIDEASDGDRVIESDAQAGAGESESVSFAIEERARATHAGVLYRDEVGNWGLVKSVELESPDGGPPPGDSPEVTPGAPGSGACANRIDGTPERDKLEGSPAADRIRGLGGRDRLRGGDGGDCVSGQGGADRVFGDDGADELKGGRGRDRLRGGPGDDVIRARRGARDRIDCGPGDDVAFINAKRDRVRRCERVRAA